MESAAEFHFGIKWDELDAFTQAHWKAAWHASRESLVIDLAPSMDAVAQALGDAYDCTRVWSAWGVGTMDQNDFCLISDDSGRITEIATAAIEAAGLKVKP